ncbi:MULTISPECIES: lytic murein transglycosylase [Psychrobacter]|uniref:Membrane-bound lytic murein transglycosylase B n=1 Tax=Psychrobacter alimentarius TaxID=261164 RepID=A0ABN4N4Z6_9GAMM|nr:MULTISPECIES: lytic murein transglycosylase [Psychrobacter]AMT98067.1 Membrane-bound lytic murein transglycosylase B [Psychrobacter alimentarius]QCB29663.1 lytic murein transglycosylase [Psychrobacter sp. PAMC27889]
MRLTPFSTLSLLSMAVGLSLASTAQAARPPAPDLSNSEFQQCLDRLQSSSKFSGVNSSTFNNYRPTQPDPSVIQSLNYQPEFQKDVWDYLSVLVDKERVEDGIRAKRQWRDTLRQIESRYGVKAEHVLGVWGVESNFGQTLGKKPLFESLATLSCFDRRQSYFQGEYANALKIVQNGDIAPNDMTGSWAGAFGQTQFMPSTFLELAVDFDGDGRRDLVNNVPDALASTANFLDKRGYRTGEPWGYEVKLPSGFWAASNRKDKKSISHWRNQGITLANGSPLPSDLSSAGLLLPAGMEGPAFLVGKNFDTFYSYNASENYALAIAHLSDLITREDSSKTDFVTAWPTDDPGISRQQAKDIQQALINAGYDIGGVDGIIGDGTRTAIQQYQSSRGIFPADGRAGQKFYRAIVGNTAPSGAQSTNQYAQPSNSQPLQPASADRMGQLIQQQTTPSNTYSTQPSAQPAKSGNVRYRRVTDASGAVKLVRVDEGS